MSELHPTFMEKESEYVIDIYLRNNKNKKC